MVLGFRVYGLGFGPRAGASSVWWVRGFRAMCWVSGSMSSRAKACGSCLRVHESCFEEVCMETDGFRCTGKLCKNLLP